MGIKVEPFGKTQNGEDIKLYSITNSKKTVLEVTDMGAIWVSMIVKDKNGTAQDVCLGLESGEEYELRSYDSFGATVGRNANRICQAKFTLNGKEYKLFDNDNGHNLHSGPNKYYTRLWEAEMISTDKGDGVEFSLFSPHMDQGYPGNLKVSVSYVLTEDDSVIIEYNAICDEDTIFNMTNHAYFNLGGHKSGSIEDEIVWLDADRFTFGADGQVTTGEMRSVEGTPMDFRTPKRIGQDIDADYEPLKRCGGYDHNFCLNNQDGEVNLFGRLKDENTGIVMDMYTDLPGVQMYAGIFISDKNKGKDNAVYHQRDGVCFETQQYPDAINQPTFPSQVIKAGQPYKTTTVYTFRTEE